MQKDSPPPKKKVISFFRKSITAEAARLGTTNDRQFTVKVIR